MRKILVIGEKTSQVKKFASTLCTNYSNAKQASMVYSYTGQWKSSHGELYEITFLPLSGHITTIDTPSGFGWNECSPIDIIQRKALVIINNKKYISVLRRVIKNMQELWLATDPDAEGDNIAYEAFMIIEKDITKNNIPIRRIWNASLTEKEIIRSFENPKEWTNNLALAVQGRRITDAWLGFAGTREITKAARRVTRVKVLSVGRVQLPTLQLVVERDLQIENFKPQKRWKLIVDLQSKRGEPFTAEYLAGPFIEKEKATKILNIVKEQKDGLIDKIEKRVQTNKPPVPLNTTSAVSLICKIMGITANKALKLMEFLYQASLLSYPRTENRAFKDGFPHSTILKNLKEHTDYEEFIESIRDSKQVKVNGPRKAEEEDHDPIHPTGETAGIGKLDGSQFQVWDILSRHYISLFMENQLIDRADIIILINNEKFWSKGSIVREIGWKKIIYWDKTSDKILPELNEGEKVELIETNLKEYETKPRPRWTDSQLIVAMERAKIGTKSSRPDIISKLESRNYLYRIKKQLISTDWGRILISTLKPIWPEIVTPQFTAYVEELMNEVAKGKNSYEKMIEELRTTYLELHKKLLTKIPEYQSLLKKSNLNMSDSTKDGKNYSKNNKKASFQNDSSSICPRCKVGSRIKRQNRKTNESFWGCSQYPNCNWTAKIPKSD